MAARRAIAKADGRIRYVVEDCTDHWDGNPCERTGSPTKPLPGVVSGKVTSQGKFAFTFGVLEARVRLPRGDWLWPAFWLLPNSTDTYGWWPKSGELDVFEGRGNDPDWRLYGSNQPAGTFAARTFL